MTALPNRYVECRLVPSPIGEDEQSAGHRIGSEFLPADCHQPVNAFAEVNRLDRQQQPHLRGELNHERCLQSPWAKARAAALS